MSWRFRSIAFWCLAAGLFCITGSKHAEAATKIYTAQPVTITNVGCQLVAPGTNQCFLIPSTPPLSSLACGGVIYIFFDSTGINQAIYATAIMALATGKTARVDYTQPGGTGSQCIVNLVQVSQ